MSVTPGVAGTYPALERISAVQGGMAHIDQHLSPLRLGHGPFHHSTLLVFGNNALHGCAAAAGERARDVLEGAICSQHAAFEAAMIG